MKSMMVNMKASQEHLIERMDQMDKEKTSTMKNLEIQMANLATSLAQRQAGHLPPQPSHNGGTLNAITTRSGASYAPPMIPDFVDLGAEDELNGAKDRDPEIEVVAEKGVQFTVPPKLKLRVTDLQTQVQADRPVPAGAAAGARALNRHGQGLPDRSVPSGAEMGTHDKGKHAASQGPSAAQKDAAAPRDIQLPFPNRFKHQKLEKQFAKFLNVVKNLQVSVPFTELLTQVP